jgi:nanoRNase/pAp phosphatase (c-di-AMP/oligoRNAs hydrolase)
MDKDTKINKENKEENKDSQVKMFIAGIECSENDVFNKIKKIVDNKDIYIYNLTHNSDIDGIVSAALLLNKKIIKNKNDILFCNYDKEIKNEIIKKINNINRKNVCLFITDFNIPQDDLEFLNSLEKFKKRGGYIIELDHHPTKFEPDKKYLNLFNVIIFGENKNFCSADLVYKFIIFNENKNKEDKILNKIVELAHLSDFYLYKGTNLEETIEKISDIIDYINNHAKIHVENKNLRRIVEYMSKNELENKFINEFYNKFKKNINKYINELNNNIYTFEIDNNIKFGVGFSTNIKSNKACEIIFSKINPNPDIVIFINRKSGSGSIRTKSIDSTELARILGGNGHPKASGFNLNLKIKTKKSKEEVLKLIKEKAENVATKLIKI